MKRDLLGPLRAGVSSISTGGFPLALTCCKGSHRKTNITWGDIICRWLCPLTTMTYVEQLHTKDKHTYTKKEKKGQLPIYNNNTSTNFAPWQLHTHVKYFPPTTSPPIPFQCRFSDVRVLIKGVVILHLHVYKKCTCRITTMTQGY